MIKLREYLDSITMYRVVLYSLLFLVASTLVLSFFDVMTYSSPGVLALTLGILVVVCGSANLLLSKIYGVAANYESATISALILFFILGTPSNTYEWIGISFAALVAMASKYIVTWRRAHIFNPAAFGVIVASLIGIGSGAWWIANETLFIPMLLVAFIVLYKLRRFEVFFVFFLSALVLILLKDPSGQPLNIMLTAALTLYPLLFLGSIMLTEPSTMPNTRTMSILFAAIVGVTYGSTVGIGPLEPSPHLALLIGNVFALLVSSRAAAQLILVEKTTLTPTTFRFAFQPSRPIPFTAGQYMEFTLPGVPLDARSNRRTFTIASAPSDPLIKIGIKFYDNGSKFKQSLQSLKIGDIISGAHVAGDFVLPDDKANPLVFIAGGIGITPFVSMIQEMVTMDIKRQIDLYYFVAADEEVAYKEILESATQHGVTTHIKIGRDSKLTDDDIHAHANANFYLSGPFGMVNAYKVQLKKSGIKKIQTDLFTGY